MSAVRKVVLSVSALFLGLSALFLVTGTATAQNAPYTLQCDEDWHTPCP
ncbi:hypothetical protein [Actinophytocola oryzae]|uniref:Uncharacterized protein n=1 Tax=Actinophytocola oryzae TaxID=502181 RepID=A0A4R7UWC6_9PSEU|nr:hypothetical protein [Actinophytocola oryzae]TDV41088.1 hypothetical protein CLV71_121154 [Actinophytocola oryzae]